MYEINEFLLICIRPTNLIGSDTLKATCPPNSEHSFNSSLDFQNDKFKISYILAGFIQAYVQR